MKTIEDTKVLLLIKIGEMYFKNFDEKGDVVLTSKTNEAYSEDINDDLNKLGRRVVSLRESGLNPLSFKKIVHTKTEISETTNLEINKLKFTLNAKL